MNKCLILTIFVQKCGCFAILVSLFGSRSTQNFSHYDDELLGTLQLFSKDSLVALNIDPTLTIGWIQVDRQHL